MKIMKHSLGALLLTGMCLSAAGAITVQLNGLSPTVCPPGKVTNIDSDCVVSGQSNGDGVRLLVTKPCTVTFDGLRFSSSADGFTPVSISDGLSVQILLKGVNSISPGQGACAIYVPTNSTLTIDSAARAEGEPLPELRVIGRWNCAAIGGHGPCSNNGNTRCDGGNIVINGGKIVAEKDPAGRWGQALGSSWGSRAGDVTVNGGTLELKTPGSIAARKTTINGGNLKLAGQEGFMTYATAYDGRLPPGYRQAESINVPNGAYIDTGYCPNQKTHVVMDVTVQYEREYWFGVWDTDYHTGAYALGNDGNLGVYFAMGNTGGSYTRQDMKKGVVPPGRHTVEIDSWVSKFDGAKSYDRRDDANANLADFQLKNTLYLFSQNRCGSAFTFSNQLSIICHGCRIYEGETPIRDFVPCVRAHDAVAGLYDTVEDKFYANAGSGNVSISANPLSTDTRPTEARDSRGDVLQRVELIVDESIAPGMKFLFMGDAYGCRDIECIGKSVFLWLDKADHQLKVSGAGGVIDYSVVWQNPGFKVSGNIDASSAVTFDAALVRAGRRLGNTSATAVVSVNGADHALDVKTDADGRFAVRLPSSARPTATVTLKQVTAEGGTVSFGTPLAVPKLPYAFRAEHADIVLADEEVTVVDSDVTVSGDLRLTGTSLGEASGQLERVVNGGITVRQPSPAKASLLDHVTASAATRIYGIGSPIVEMDAQIKGKLEKLSTSDQYLGRLGILYAYLSPRSSETINRKEFNGYDFTLNENKEIRVAYTISKAQNFGYAFVNSAHDIAKSLEEPKGWIDPNDLYKLFSDREENYVDYTAPADGFVTVSVSAPDKTFGGIAVTMDFSDRDTTPQNREWYCPFTRGWHRCAGAVQLLPGVTDEDRHTAQLPKFDRTYTAVMRKGDHMNLRVLLEPNRGFQDPDVNTDINLSVKVVFRPLGFAE